MQTCNMSYKHVQFGINIPILFPKTQPSQLSQKPFDLYV